MTMMTNHSTTPRFALGSAMVWLTMTAAVAAGVSWLCIAKVLGDTQSTATLATLSMAGVNWLAALAGIVMIAAVASKGSLAVVIAYFGGATVRFALNLFTVVVLALVLTYDIKVIVVALAAAYLPLLLVEAGLIGWFLWQQDDQAKNDTQTATLNITEAVA